MDNKLAIVVSIIFWVSVLFFVIGKLVNRKPTAKMISYAYSLSYKNNLKLPDITNFDAVRDFLDEYGHYQIGARLFSKIQMVAAAQLIIMSSIGLLAIKMGPIYALVGTVFWVYFTIRNHRSIVLSFVQLACICLACYMISGIVLNGISNGILAGLSTIWIGVLSVILICLTAWAIWTIDDRFDSDINNITTHWRRHGSKETLKVYLDKLIGLVK